MKRVRSSSSVRVVSSVLAGEKPVLGGADGLAGVSEAVTDASRFIVAVCRSYTASMRDPNGERS
jgi:hypothetical protein